MRFTRLLQHADFFRVLNLEADATDSDVKKAYLREAKKWHPDTNKQGDASKRFQLINEAYNNLKTNQLREQYRFELSLESSEDWTQRGRKDSKYNMNAHNKNYNDIQYEFDQAEQRWKYKNQNSNLFRFQYQFFNKFEKFIHPYNLFFMLPLGLLAFWVATNAVKTRTDTDSDVDVDVDVINGKSINAKGSSVKGKSKGESDKVEAWLNPTTQQWEVPAPWDPLFKHNNIKFVNRSLVYESTSKKRK